jgi:rhodanese-related sulfurtransferase
VLTTSPEHLRACWRERREVALFDAREEGPYADAHPLWAVSLPLSRIEARVLELVPRTATPIVVYDDGEGLAALAAERIAGLGYSNVSVLEGGLSAYAKAGEVYRDVNVPSKAFGELVEAIRHTPSLSAEEVKALIDGGADMVVLDARRFEEYRTMSIPGATSVPGGELALRALDMAPSRDTLVVVNCAGRTRSIIGTQSLVNAGLPNRVAALRNGTIGWTLAGFSLDTGQQRRAGEVSAATHARQRDQAARWADHVGVRVIDKATLDQWLAEAGTRTLHRFDVRHPEEYVAGHPAGFLSAPGGQLVQATDEWVAVRGAHLVLWDDDGVRARMTASWLVQMGWEAVVVEDPAITADEPGIPAPRRAALPDLSGVAITPTQLQELSGAAVADVGPSPAYRKGHVPGAVFVLRSRFATDLAAVPGSGPIVLASPDGILAAYARQDAAAHTARPIRVLAGGTDAWRAAGLPVQSGRDTWTSPPIDVYKRPYEGTDNAREKMQAYIDWELGLVAQLANDGVSNFRVER